LRAPTKKKRGNDLSIKEKIIENYSIAVKNIKNY
jgi:hypothetical protein